MSVLSATLLSESDPVVTPERGRIPQRKRRTAESWFPSSPWIVFFGALRASSSACGFRCNEHKLRVVPHIELIWRARLRLLPGFVNRRARSHRNLIVFCAGQPPSGRSCSADQQCSSGLPEPPWWCEYEQRHCRGERGTSHDYPVAKIAIEPGGQSSYRVTVDDGGRRTTHTVTVTSQDLDRYAPAGTTAERLLEASFEFLLEREPASSILSTFGLPVIERYFPEYPREIRKRM